MSETRYEDRSDSIAEKIQRLQRAHGLRDFEVAMSLCESIKDTLTFERVVAGGSSPQEPVAGAGTFVRVDTLPPSWAEGMAGWEYGKVLAVTETAGLARAEPVEVAFACRGDQVADLRREIRVLRVDEREGSAREIPSQVQSEAWIDGERHGRVIFVARVPADGTVHFVVLYGNPHAELPEYTTDLKVHGEDCGLCIDNHHFGARLASHTGQMERLTYSAHHRSIVSSSRNPMSSGLQLYAGGDGHGETPHIDWAHDYAAAGQFQKFRLTHWARVPSYEVIRGPLCVQVRRWGFPHGPAHPLFTPSRLHLDVSYTFFAGVPWFLKESRMTVLRDFEGVIRDDEWVFSGQPFTDTLWMDRDGSLHEGSVAAGHEEQVWGLGFYHRQTRDAFIALFLEHGAEGRPPLIHGGATQLDYQGIPRHAQLWSRSPARNGKLSAGSVLRQRNAYLVTPYDGPETAESTRRRMMHPLRIRASELPMAVASAATALELRTRPSAASAALRRSIWSALAQVRDDMFYTVDANIVDMGYVYDVRVEGDTVRVLLTMPHRGRPEYGFLVGPVRETLLAIDGVREVVVEFTWEPAWTVARLTARGRAAMGLDP